MMMCNKGDSLWDDVYDNDGDDDREATYVKTGGSFPYT